MRATGFVTVAGLAALACSSSLGGGQQDIPPEGITAPIPCALAGDPRPVDACPNHPYAAGTALAALATMESVATAAYGTPAKWAGIVQGVGIRRDGTVVAGDTGAGWVSAWCEANRVLTIDGTDGGCAARNRCDCPAGPCDGVDCAAIAEVAFPRVDSDAAIAAAFPGDPAGTTYAVAFASATNAWTITSSAAPDAPKRVDGDTGAVGSP